MVVCAKERERMAVGVMKMTGELGAVVVAAAAVVAAIAVARWIWVRPKRKERLLREMGYRGRGYRILVGDRRDEFMSLQESERGPPIPFSSSILPRVSPFLFQTFNSYGKQSFIWRGTNPIVTIMDPDMIKEIFANPNDFRRLRANPVARLLIPGLVDYEGSKWAKHRKIIGPAFYPHKLKGMIKEFHLSCESIFDKWGDMVCKESSCEIDVWPDLQQLTMDAISRTAFGSNYEKGRKIFYLHQELAILEIEALRSVSIPGWRFVPTGKNRRMRSIVKEVKQILTGMIEERAKAVKSGESPDDLLGLLLESSMKEVEEQGGGAEMGLRTEEIIEECRLFYFAGQETTSVLLVWTMILLSIHQDWQERARDEVLQAFGDRIPDFDGLNRLKIMSMILNEVLRLYPPAPALTRVVKRKVKLGRSRFPVETQLMVPIVFLQREKEVWGEDADEFNPERFAKGTVEATKGRITTFIPFGWGPRICIGQNFAITEARLVMALILQRFRFSMSPSYAHAPAMSVFIVPQHGAQLLFSKIQ